MHLFPPTRVLQEFHPKLSKIKINLAGKNVATSWRRYYRKKIYFLIFDTGFSKKISQVGLVFCFNEQIWIYLYMRNFTVNKKMLMRQNVSFNLQPSLIPPLFWTPALYILWSDVLNISVDLTLSYWNINIQLILRDRKVGR